jgi:hypothetical protein
MLETRSISVQAVGGGSSILKVTWRGRKRTYLSSHGYGLFGVVSGDEEGLMCGDVSSMEDVVVRSVV